jgi:hypothetical protein
MTFKGTNNLDYLAARLHARRSRMPALNAIALGVG